MDQTGLLNRERAAFLVFSFLFAWGLYGELFERPMPEDPPSPVTNHAQPLGEIESMPAPPPLETVLNPQEGRDPFVPHLLAQREVIVKKPTDPREDNPPQERQPPRPRAALVQFAPPEQDETDTEPSKPTVPENERYKLPLAVKGWISPSQGNPLRLLATSAEGGPTFTLEEGDSYKGVVIRKLTPESAEFENPEGTIIEVERDELLGDDELFGAFPSSAGRRLPGHWNRIDPVDAPGASADPYPA